MARIQLLTLCLLLVSLIHTELAAAQGDLPPIEEGESEEETTAAPVDIPPLDMGEPEDSPEETPTEETTTTTAAPAEIPPLDMGESEEITAPPPLKTTKKSPVEIRPLDIGESGEITAPPPLKTTTAAPAEVPPLDTTMPEEITAAPPEKVEPQPTIIPTEATPTTDDTSTTTTTVAPFKREVVKPASVEENGGDPFVSPDGPKHGARHVRAHDGFHNIKNEPLWAHWNDAFTTSRPKGRNLE